ncbi:probable isoprenylcysteine alpha-carbonyl methylesterase ICME isoform X2 [Typha angustifolia]|uniref:probable isoprenylcysteine alpha-carbonyl methylesterase ICME isoform X2 n=1 Tax=Typha angustifolia TaxID=59011 RepID=UPI003C2D7BC3
MEPTHFLSLSSSSSSPPPAPMQSEVANPEANGTAADGGNPEAPFLRRTSSRSRRRRSPEDHAACGRPSFRRDVGHAAAETYLVSRLALILLQYLGVGYRWISRFLALSFYAILLMPGFLQVGYYYFFSSQIRRSVVYGEQPRNRLDLYLPQEIDRPRPVVAFITGGAWIIGNFPQGTISDMVRDASQGISFVCNNIASYGGDPDQIYLMGQSAGAHIAACNLVDQANKEARGESTTWSASQIKAYFGLSGGYNMLNLVDHFHERGLYRKIFLSIMEGEQSLRHFSPEVVVQESSVQVISMLPPIILFHGTGDYSIPSSASQTFADVLQSAGAQVKLVLFEGKTHTDLFLQDPLRGGRDELVEDIVAVILASDATALAKAAVAPIPQRMVPEWQLKLARQISPF